jgi:hypothetical protein
LKILSHFVLVGGWLLKHIGQNLNMRMSVRRFTRLTNTISKKLENHVAAISLHFMHDNFVRIHQSLRMPPVPIPGHPVIDLPVGNLRIQPQPNAMGRIECRKPRPDAVQFVLRIGTGGGQISPNRLWPASIPRRASHDVQVQLRHHIPNRSEVDLPKLPMVADKLCQDRCLRNDFVTIGPIQIQEVRNVHFRHQNEPGNLGVSVQEEMAPGKTAQNMTIHQELRMDFEQHGDVSPGQAAKDEDAEN